MQKRFIVVLFCIVSLFLISCGKSKPAKEVETLISEIGEVSLDSEEAIVAAEEYYDQCH